MKHYLFSAFFVALFSFGLSFQAKACDFTPSVSATNIVDNGDGTFTFEVLMCVGTQGSENGPLIYLSDGINILSTSQTELVNPINGNVATASIIGGQVTYSYAGAPAFWVVDNDEFGPCFAFTLTVDSDPSAATVSFEGINDNCLNDISGGVWSTSISAGGSCVADASVIAPASFLGNTNGAGNDCDLRPSDDQTIEVEIQCAGVYTFSTCDTALWDTYLYLSLECCDGVIAENDDLCDAQSEITTYLPVGTYYLTIEGFFAVNDGEYGLNITEGEPLYKAETGPDQDICETTTTISGNEPIFGSGMWSVLTGNATIVNPDSATTEVIDLSNGVNQFIWTFGEEPCVSSSDTITVVAAGNLTITCPSDVVVNNEPDECSAVVNYATPTGSSECSTVTVTQISGLGSGSTFPVGTTIEQYLVTDTLGNSDSCSVSITVIDAESPTISCPSDINVENDPDLCSAVVNYTAPTGADNCQGATTSLISGLPSGSPFPVGTTTNVFQVTDGAGNTNVCAFDVTVTDSESPVFDCPDDISVSLMANSCDTILNFDPPTATDNCPGLGAITQTAGPVSGSVFEAGTSTITYEVTDAAGNTSTCSFDITVIEPVLPEITCPGDLEFDVSPGTCGHVANYVPPTGTDNCPGAVTTLIAGLGPGALFPVGTTTETYQVTDASGNTAECSFTITVNDTIVPTIACPGDIEVDNDPDLCGAEVNFTPPTGADNCPDFDVSLTSPLGPGDFFPVGTSVVSYAVEDDSGNIAICTFNVTVNDIQAPDPLCGDIVVDNDPGVCEAVVDYPVPTATDNCEDDSVTVTLVSGQGPGATFPVGTHEEIYSFEDEAGNASVCTINIIVEDNEAPTLTCPEDQVIVLPEAACDSAVTYVTPVGIDNCPGVTTNLISGSASGTTLVAGEYDITYEAEDAAGNTTSCTFTITVIENVLPTITCPGDTTVYTTTGTCEVIVNYDEPVGEDNCPGATTSQTDGLGTGALFPIGTTTETYVVTDLSGNTASCSFTVTVVDTIAPTIDCPDDIEVDADMDECTAVVNYPTPTASDDCDDDVEVTLISGPASGSEFVVGETTIVFEAEDESGNTTTCSFTVTVNGNSQPSITCPDDIVIASTVDTCGAIVEYPFPEAEDACGGDVTVTLDSGLDSGSFFPLGTTTVVYTVTNTLGNTASCSFDVTVVDEEAPVIECPDDIELTADGDICEFEVTWADATAADNCSLMSVEQTGGDPSGSTFGIGTSTITYTATDGSGNTSECSFNIIITDVVDPTISDCPEDITVDTDAGECGAVVNYEPPTGDDNCDFTLELTSGLDSGSLFPVGETTVTWTVTDLSGNAVSCSFTVTVNDNIAPTITCPEDIVVCDSVVNYSFDADDNCSVSVDVTEGPNSGDIFNIGTTTVTLLATDPSGNTATCSFTVTVEEGPDEAFAGPDQLICDGNSTELEANTPTEGTGVWSIVSGTGTLSDINDPNATLNAEEGGFFILSWTVSGAGSCPSTSDEVTISFGLDITVDAGPDVTINSGESTQLEATSSDAVGLYTWSPETGLSCTNCTDPVASPSTTTTYTVTYTNNQGCEYTDQITVTVFSQIPTGFTPDGDDVNDVWNIPNVTPDTEVIIYNRWGNEIFQSVGYNDPWDGEYNGKPLPLGAYYYVINYNDGSEPLNGTVTPDSIIEKPMAMNRTLLLVVSLLVASAGFAQQLPQYSQYMHNLYVVNPASAGMNDYLDVNLSFRQQWTGIDEAPRTYYLSATGALGKGEKPEHKSLSIPISRPDLYSPNVGSDAKRKLKHGLGGIAMVDEYGPFQRTIVNLGYALHIPVGKTFYASVGASLGWSGLQFDNSNIILEDQNDNTYNDFVGRGDRTNMFDLNLGVMFYNENLFVGYGLYQILQNNVKLGGSNLNISEAQLADHHYIVAGYRIGVGENIGITPSTMIKNQGPAPVSFDVNMKFDYQRKYWLGFSYRHEDAAVAMLGVTIADLIRVGYSYDYTLSELNDFSNGSHEIVLGLMLFNN